MLGILILQKSIQKEFKKLTNKLLKNLIMMELSFQCTKNFNQIEVNKNIFVNVFGYENELVFPIYVSDKTFQDSMDFLLLIDDNISHYVYIKYLGRFMFRKTKNKNKKWFCRSSLQCYSRESVLIKHKEDS